MANVFFLVIVLVNSDGTTEGRLLWPQESAKNTYEACQTAGSTISAGLQGSVSVDKTKVFWYCKPVNFNSLVKLLPQP